MHSLSYRHLSVNKPGVWVICGMRFRWNVRPINIWKCQGYNAEYYIEYHVYIEILF